MCKENKGKEQGLGKPFIFFFFQRKRDTMWISERVNLAPLTLICYEGKRFLLKDLVAK